MGHAAVASVVTSVRRYLAAREMRDQADAELLERFVAARDDAVFAALVERHGPLVWGVCRRLLRNHADAEDAFQATFLVLVRKAAALRKDTTIGPWLFGVARRTALKARVLAAKRARHERTACAIQSERDESIDNDSSAVLDAELERLPAKYRLPILLCHLEGRTTATAAAQLGWPHGTLMGRLSRGRELLRTRLARRGVTSAALGLGLAGGAHALAAALSPSLVTSTSKAATAFAAGAAAGLNPAAHLAAHPAVAALTQGVLQAMFFDKLRMTIALSLCIGVLLGSAGLLSTIGLRQAAHGTPPSLLALPIADSGQPTIAVVAKQKQAPGPTVRGTVTAVDAGKNTLTLTVPKEGTKQREEKTLTLAPDAPVVFEDVLEKKATLPTGKLSDLTAGVQATAELTADGKLVARLSARGPSMMGHVKQVEPAQNAITITVKDKEAGGVNEHRFVLAEGAKVLLSDGLSKGDKDVEGKLADIGEGTTVNLQLTVKRDRALSVRVQGRGLFGILKSHDAGNNSITIRVKEDGQVVEKTFTLAKNARVNNLSPEEPVNLRFSVFDKEVVVSAEGRKRE